MYSRLVSSSPLRNSMRPSRRTFLATSAAMLTSVVASRFVIAEPLNAESAGSFSLPELPYAYGALAPVVDEQTMTIHHTKHHQGYVNKLNSALTGQVDWSKMSVEDILRKIESVPESIRTAVRNNGGGHANHSMFWKVMKPSVETSQPSEKLADAITSQFGSLNNMKEAFGKAGATQFGSGWAWLVINGDRLEVVSTANQDSPLSSGKTPILGLDVWEHAYYLNYQNRRTDYIAAFWKVVNWDQVAKNFAAA